MEKEIFDFISATFGISAAVTLAIIALALWLTHYITKKITAIRYEHDAIKEKHDEHDRKVKGMDSDLSFCKASLKSAEKGTLPNFRGKAKRMSNKTEMITVI